MNMQIQHTTHQSQAKAAAHNTGSRKTRNAPVAQLVDNRPEAQKQREPNARIQNSLQAKQAAQLQIMANNYTAKQDHPIQKKNNTGLPDNLKSGVENLSGYSMDDVKVHYNSSQPAQLNAHAYAQGTDIHIAPGQEKHLPHEAWHVVQQKQGRVKPTMQMKGKVNINDDAGLEKEADGMGVKALVVNNQVMQRAEQKYPFQRVRPYASTASGSIVQMNKDQEEMDNEFKALKIDFDTDKEEFEEKRNKLDEMLVQAGTVHLMYRFYQNRWERYRVEWQNFFAFNPERLLDANDHVKSKTALRKFQQKMNWYRKSGDGKQLLNITFNQFIPVLQRQIDAQKHQSGIEARMDTYEQMLGPDRREVGKVKDQHLNHINAIAHDPNVPENLSLVQVEDTGPTVDSDMERNKARQYLQTKFGDIPEKWRSYLEGESGQTPDNVKEPQFRNLFGEDTVLMGDNFRPPWHKYFASDVFFSQWLAALEHMGKEKELPVKFPSTFYRNNISNAQTNAVINKIIPGEEDAIKVIRPGHANWEELLETPNGGSTVSIVNEYNQINRARGQDEYRIKSIQVYRTNHANCLKFNMGT